MSDLPADTLTTTIAQVIKQHQLARGRRDMRTHCTCGWDSTRARLTDFGPTHADQLADHVAAAVVSVLATHNEHTAADEGAVQWIKRLFGAWDCCGTCAGGVLAERERRIKADAWDEGYTRWYGHARRKTSKYPANPYRLAAVSPTPPTHKEQADGALPLRDWSTPEGRRIQ